MQTPKRSFEIVRVVQGGSTTARVRIVCRQCPAHHELSLGRRLPPDAITKKFIDAKWTKHNREDWLCPACAGGKNAGRRSDDKGGHPMQSVTKLPTRSPSPAQPGATPPATQGLPRPLTHDERVMIRMLLDENFDDTTGRYKAGWSDQKIADEANVPRRHVEDIRETAYGPIRDDPAHAEIRTIIKGMDDRMQTIRDDHDKLKKTFASDMEYLTAEMAKAREKLAALEKK